MHQPTVVLTAQFPENWPGTRYIFQAVVIRNNFWCISLHHFRYHILLKFIDSCNIYLASWCFWWNCASSWNCASLYWIRVQLIMKGIYPSAAISHTLYTISQGSDEPITVLQWSQLVMGHSLEGFKHPFINVLPSQTVSGNHLKVSYFMAKQSNFIKFNRNYLENKGLKSHLDRIIIAITVTLQEGHAISVNIVNWTVCSIVCSPNSKKTSKLSIIGSLYWESFGDRWLPSYFHVTISIPMG